MLLQVADVGVKLKLSKNTRVQDVGFKGLGFRVLGLIKQKTKRLIVEGSWVGGHFSLIEIASWTGDCSIRSC